MQGFHYNFIMESRKRKAISLETKYEILEAVKKGSLSKTEIARQFDIQKSTLSTILKNSNNIYSAYLQSLDNVPDNFFSNINEMSAFIEKTSINSMKQSKITDLFAKKC